VRSSHSTVAHRTAAGLGGSVLAGPSDRGRRCDGLVPVHMVAGDDRSTLSPLAPAALCAPRAQEEAPPTRTVRLPPLWSLVLRTRSGRPTSCSDGKASFVMMAGGGVAASCGPDAAVVVVGAVDGPQTVVVVVVDAAMSTDRRGWMGGDARRWTLLKAAAPLLLLLLSARRELAGAVRWQG
jgi:hypothetical protein